MQKVACYRLTLRDRMNWLEMRSNAFQQVMTAIETWLRSKGADPDLARGEYASVDKRSSGSFEAMDFLYGDRRLRQFRLREVSPDGTVFRTEVSACLGEQSVTFYCTHEVGSTVIRPVATDAYTPKVVRDLLGAVSGWHTDDSALHPLRFIEGESEGRSLADEILNPRRSVPIVVVSSPDGAPCLPKLDEKLAFDLAGLANVFSVDDFASDGLFEGLGRHATYDGAVRVYWPRVSLKAPPHLFPLWTAQRLLDAGSSFDVRERFRRQLRALIMQASVAGAVHPREHDEIRDEHQRSLIRARLDAAETRDDVEQIAELYVAENDELRATNHELREKNEELAAKLSSLQEAFQHVPSGKRTDTNDIEPEASPNQSPSDGEIRFYKKIHDTGKFDKFEEIKDCGHDTWDRARKADKAIKGLKRLGGRNFRRLDHCRNCTGGGVWRVEW